MALLTVTAINHNGLLIPEGVVIAEDTFTEEELEALVEVGSVKVETEKETTIREALEAKGLDGDDDEENFGGISLNELDGATDDNTLSGDSLDTEEIE